VARSDTEYLKQRGGIPLRKDTDPSMDTMGARLDALERDKGEAERPLRRDERPPDRPLEVAVSRRMLRMQLSLPLAAALAATLSAAATSVVSYVVSLDDDRKEHLAVVAEVETMRARLDTHETAMAAAANVYRSEIARTDLAVRTMAQVQLLQWVYVTQVVEAARARKPIPLKPLSLIEAEAKAAISIRDAP